MIKYEIQKFEEKVPHKIICDVCGKEIEMTIEEQEVLYINFIGGYGSVFGDGSEVKAEICQDCVKKLLGKYLRIDEDVDLVE